MSSLLLTEQALRKRAYDSVDSFVEFRQMKGCRGAVEWAVRIDKYRSAQSGQVEVSVTLVIDFDFTFNNNKVKSIRLQHELSRVMTAGME